MVTLILATTANRAPGAQKITEDKEVTVSSSRWVIFPREDGISSTIFVNGYEYDVDAEPAELKSALQSESAVVLSLAITSVRNPAMKNIKVEKSETVQLVSDKFLVESKGTGSIVFVNGFEFESATSQADVATALSATDASSYT